MKRFLTIVAAGAAALTFAGIAAAAVSPWTFKDAGVTCAVSSTLSGGILHLSKPCSTSTAAAAGATVTGISGTLSSLEFTLASKSQCQGGSPRFNVQTSAGFYFLGCNNVTPTMNVNGTATYSFTPATLAAGGSGLSFPSGTVQSIDVLIDVQGSADISKIKINGHLQKPVPNGQLGHKGTCKKGGWKNFTSPHFKNQGQCIAYFNRH